MPDNIGTMADGRASFAFRGDRRDIWHRKGNQYQPTWTLDDWARHSGLNFTAYKIPALGDFSCIPDAPCEAHERVPGRYFIARGDNRKVLSPGSVSEQYQIVQPRDVLEWFERYVRVDPRFQIDVAGALFGGETIWAAAVFNGDTTVAGEKHRARLLMTTTFDGTGSTINRGCVTRAVCNNTLDAACAEGGTGGVVRTQHRSKFDPEKVGKELAHLAASFAGFKAMGDALAAFHCSDTDVSTFFKLTLEIDPRAKQEEISKSKFKKFEELIGCYKIGTRQEDLQPRTGWAMLQAITRYADHNKVVRGSDGTPAGIADLRFGTSVIEGAGSGSQLKARSVRILDDLMQGALRAAASKATREALEVD